MRQGWEYKKLGDCAEILDSQRKPVTKKDRQGGIYPYYGATGIQDYVDNYIFDGRYVLVGEDGAKWSAFDQSAYIIEGKSWVNNHAHVLKPYSWICDSYVTYFLNYSDLDSYISGAIVRKLTQAALRNIDIPLPPKSTQQAIVSELDKINELIRLKKEQLKDYDNLTQSIFYDMFGDPVENEKGWEVKKLGKIALVKTGPFGSMLHKEDYITNGIPLINPMHMQDYKVVPNNDFTISYEKASELSNYILHENDVIFARRGDIGRCAVVTKQEEGFLCGTGSLFVRFDSEVSPLYTMYVVRADSFAKDLISKAKGATMLNLNSTTMEHLTFPIPPLPLQQSFANRIEAIERQKAEVHKAITELETLLASRMQFWFDVNEAADAIVSDYDAEKKIKDKYDELYSDGHNSLSVNHGGKVPCVVNDIDFRSLASAYNYILDNGANTFEKIQKELCLTIDKIHFCVLVELGFISTEDYLTFNIPL